jgi:hypothetical protein
MSTTTTTTPGAPFQQWQNFYPGNSGYPGFPVGNYPNYPMDSPTTINSEIYATVRGTGEQTKQQAANDIARDILRAVEQNGAGNASTTERTSSQVASAVERNGANNMSTTERTSSQLATAIERNGALNSHISELTAAQLATAIERNGANGMSTTERVNSQLASAVDRNGSANLAAIERTSGEARLTTVVADAANRQAANDSIRDVLRSVDRTGFDAVTSTKDAYNGILASVERNSGETRLANAIGQGVTDSKLTDVRHSVLNDVNRVGSDILSASTQSLNVLTKHVTDSAWEGRTALSAGFNQLGEEHLRTKFDIVKMQDAHYASMMLEQQKLGQYMASKVDNHFAANQLEMQKVKEGLYAQSADNFAIGQLETQKVKESLYTQASNNFAINQLEMQKVREGLSSQASTNFAITQLEMQKVKEGLATQSAQQFAISQLEAQKNRESIQKDLADAKYESLKSQQYLSDKMSECCCEIKGKIDLIDRDRLRDNLVVEREDNNLFKILAVAGLGRDGYDGYGRHYHSRSRSPGRRR